MGSEEKQAATLLPPLLSPSAAFDRSEDMINAELHVKQVPANHDPALPPKLPQTTPKHPAQLPPGRHLPAMDRAKASPQAVMEVCTFGSSNTGVNGVKKVDPASTPWFTPCVRVYTAPTRPLACTPHATNEHVHS